MTIKSLALACTALTFATTTALAQYVGPNATPTVSNVAAALKASDDTPVVLEGRILRQVGKENTCSLMDNPRSASRSTPRIFRMSVLTRTPACASVVKWKKTSSKAPRSTSTRSKSWAEAGPARSIAAWS